MKSGDEYFREEAMTLFEEAGRSVSHQILEYLDEQGQTVGPNEGKLVGSIVGFILTSWFNRSECFFDFTNKCQENHSVILGLVVPILEVLRSVADDEKLPDAWRELIH